MTAGFETLYSALRPELTAYLRHMVVRSHVAEELTQTTFQRWIEAGPGAPRQPAAARAWLFKVATNLAIDELRRHSTWRETMVEDLRRTAEANPEFVKRSAALVGTPETKLIAREHLAACFSCTARNLPGHQAAAFWLTEVHDFSLAETAEFLAARPTQVKNWLQKARSFMCKRYEATCALMSKQGVCYQCSELADFFGSDERNPISGSTDSHEARIKILRDVRTRPWGPWHEQLLRFVDDLT